MNKNNMVHKSSSIIALLGGLKLSSLYKFSFLLGSRTIFFSAASFLMPALGRYRSISETAILGLSAGFLHALFFGWSLASSALWIPGICAAWYWKIESHWYRVGLPFFCVVAFLAHPTGMAAAPYAFYWFIPCGIAFLPRRNLLFDACASTFIAHAVGSTIWLYTVSMHAEQWLVLIPLVALERIVSTLGITGIVTLVSFISVYKKEFMKMELFDLVEGNPLVNK